MSKKIAKTAGVQELYESIRKVIDNARGTAYRAVNFAMVQAYWQIGKLIVEAEQKGNKRAEYGEELIVQLSERLSADLGKGFNTTNVWYMRQFYLTFRKLHALRGELSWTHYRLLLKVERDDAKQVLNSKNAKPKRNSERIKIYKKNNQKSNAVNPVFEILNLKS